MIVMNRPVVKLTQCSSKFNIVKVTKEENLRGRNHFENKKTKSNKRTKMVIRTINSVAV